MLVALASPNSNQAAPLPLETPVVPSLLPFSLAEVLVEVVPLPLALPVVDALSTLIPLALPLGLPLPLPLPLSIAIPEDVAVVTLAVGIVVLCDATKADSSGNGS